MQVVTRLDVVVDEGLFTSVLVFKLQNLRLFSLIHNLTEQILDRVATVVNLWKLKHRQ